MTLIQLLSLCTAFLASGCGFRSETHVVGAGPTVGRDYQVVAFNEIKVSGNFACTFVPADVYQVRVETHENLFPYFEIVSDGHCLKIATQSNATLKTTDPIKVLVKAPHVERVALSGASTLDLEPGAQEALKIDASGSCRIRGDEFVVNVLNLKLAGNSRATVRVNGRLEAKLTGSSELVYRGKASHVDINASGASLIEGFDTPVEALKIDASGAVKAHVAVEKSLHVDASGASSVTYTGSPVVEQHLSGAATLRKQ